MANEVSTLSTDINVITAEINAYQRMAGEAVFEIGKRLNHVKENDLAHGEFGKWLESIGINRNTAGRLMKVYETFDGYEELLRLGKSKLFEVMTLGSRKEIIDFTKTVHTVASTGESKTVREMTIKEIREVKQSRIRSAQPKVKRELINTGSKSCRICGYGCTPILHLHHIKDVQYGGDNSPENIVLLCPNCHAIVHTFMSDRAEKEYGLEYLVQWINANLPAEGIQTLRELWAKRVA